MVGMKWFLDETIQREEMGEIMCNETAYLE